MKYSEINIIIIIIIIIFIILFILNQYFFKKEYFISVGHASAISVHSSSNNPTYKPGSNKGGNNSNGGGCFSKDTLLQLEDGTTMKIIDAKIGDKILSYSENKLIYAPIIAIPHEKNNILSKFIEIKTSNNKNIKMTECHLIPVLKNNKFELIKANNIELNNIIITVDGYESITDKNITYEYGIYTVVTTGDYIVVNNIIASPFAISHLLGNFYYQLHKIIYNITEKNRNEMKVHRYFPEFTKENTLTEKINETQFNIKCT